MDEYEKQIAESLHVNNPNKKKNGKSFKWAINSDLTVKLKSKREVPYIKMPS